MNMKRWDMVMELIEVSQNVDVPILFRAQVAELLKNNGGYTLDYTLSELINTYEHDCSQEWVDISIVEDASPTQVAEQSDEELFAMIFDEIDNENNPEFSVQRTHDDEILELKMKYSRKIAPRQLYLPVSQWDRASFSFYCSLSNFDPRIDEILYFFRRFTYDGYSFFDLEDFGKLITEFEEGLNDARKLAELIYNKEFYQQPENSTGNSVFRQNENSPNKAITTAHARAFGRSGSITQKLSTPSILTYFELNSDYNKLKSFRIELEHLGYIDKNLSTEAFRKVFLFREDPLKARLKQQPSTPIEWLINKSHLGYLIKQLSKNNIIAGNDYFKIAENCFLFKGKPIANTVFHGMQLPAEPVKRKIDKIVSGLR